MVQLSLFDEHPVADRRPHPLIIADKWGFNLAYVDQDGNPDNYLYAGLDWFKGLGGSSSRWSRTKDELLLSTQQLPYKAGNHRTYQIDFVDQGALYTIAMEMRLLKSRPQLEEIRNYLRDAGVFVDQVRRDPEKAIARIKGIRSRIEFTAALVNTITDLHSNTIAIATNKVYKGLFGRTAADLKEQLGTPHIRDAMSTPALHITGLCEWICAQTLGEAQTVTEDQAFAIVESVSDMLGIQVNQIEHRMKIDLVTGQKLLSTGIEAIKGA